MKEERSRFDVVQVILNEVHHNKSFAVPMTSLPGLIKDQAPRARAGHLRTPSMEPALLKP